LPLIKFQNHCKHVNRVCFFKNSSRLSISSSEDGTLKIYDIKQCLVIRTLNFPSEKNNFDAVDTSYSGFFVASACRKTCNIYIWSLKSGEIIEILKGHKQFISGLYFVEKKFKVVSGSLDKTFRLWNFESKFNLRNFCFCEVFRTYEKVLVIKIHPNLYEIALLIKNDSVFFFNIKKQICLSRIQKPFRILFKQKKSSEDFSYKFSLIYSFNGKVILLGNSKQKIFSFTRSLPFFIKIYTIPFFKANIDCFFPIVYGKKRIKNFLHQNDIIELSSHTQNNKWIALSKFGIFLFIIKEPSKLFNYFFPFLRTYKFHFFLEKTFFWMHFWKKNFNSFMNSIFVLKKLYNFFNDSLNRNNTSFFGFYRILEIFKIQKNFSITEICFFFNLFSETRSENYLQSKKKKIKKKFNDFKTYFLKKIESFISQLFFFIEIKKLMPSYF
jgi:WD40 repeat protein